MGGSMDCKLFVLQLERNRQCDVYWMVLSWMNSLVRRIKWSIGPLDRAVQVKSLVVLFQTYKQLIQMLLLHVLLLLVNSKRFNVTLEINRVLSLERKKYFYSGLLQLLVWILLNQNQNVLL